jgi:F-type H+-transporting ATPase subunit epsilon
VATMHVEVVSAERAVLSLEARELYARGVEGQIGILPGHQPTLVALDVGPVKVVAEDGHVELVAVHNGLLFVDAEKGCIVLADLAERRLADAPHDEVLLQSLRKHRVRLEVAEQAGSDATAR